MTIAANNLLKSFQGSFPALEELRIGRAFMLFELTDDFQIMAAEVILRHVQSDFQEIDMSIFVVYSTDAKVLPPGDTLERKMCLSKTENMTWTLAIINYY